MSETLLFALPEHPDPDRRETHWWRVVDGEIVDAGDGEEWLALTGKDRSLVALAPAGQVRLSFSDAPPSTATSRQAAAVSRVAAVEASLGEKGTLHAVSDVAPDGIVATAVVDNAVMAAWLDWAKELGADPNHVVPVGALLPLSDGWTSASVGAEAIVGRRGTVLPNEPELTALLVGDAEVRLLDREEVSAALAAASTAPPLDLRTGRFGRRRTLDRGRVRELVILTALIPLLMLAWALVSVIKLDRATDRLDSETLRVASGALGRPVALESAEAELAQRSGSSAFGGLMSPLTATYQALQPEKTVSATTLSYVPDGTLSVTLAAPNVGAINRVLLALQSNGYKVTAVSRQSPDGRQMVDATVRSGP